VQAATTSRETTEQQKKVGSRVLPFTVEVSVFGIGLQPVLHRDSAIINNVPTWRACCVMFAAVAEPESSSSAQVSRY
jgi:hypothetical protein